VVVHGPRDGLSASVHDRRDEDLASSARAPRTQSQIPSYFLPMVDFSHGDADSNGLTVSNEAAVFSALYSAIDGMKSLPTGFSDAVDDETAFDAERVLGFIEASGVPAPKIFSHGGDAVVFTWDFDPINRYLTISGGDAAFLDVNKDSFIQCPYEIVPLDSPDASSLLRLLGNAKVVKNADKR
jgi:ribosomal protein S12 methylthiotransferase accessory factor YcaO